MSFIESHYPPFSVVADILIVMCSLTFGFSVYVAATSSAPTFVAVLTLPIMLGVLGGALTARSFLSSGKKPPQLTATNERVLLIYYVPSVSAYTAGFSFGLGHEAALVGTSLGVMMWLIVEWLYVRGWKLYVRWFWKPPRPPGPKGRENWPDVDPAFSLSKNFTT